MPMIMAQHSIDDREPEWIVCESELKDLKSDIIEGIVKRKREWFERLEGGLPHSSELAIRSRTRIHQIIVKGKSSEKRCDQ